MDFPKQLKDQVYKLLQEPTLDKFRDFLHAQMGEHNAIDFKSKWIENATLVKEMLALANSQGGFIVFGVAENEDKSIRIDGLPKIKDKAVISNEIKNFISSNLKYEIYDFSYNTSEYEALNDKNFQMLVVEDTPECIPFLSKKDSGSLKQNMIYVRRGTSCEIANEEELQAIQEYEESVTFNKKPSLWQRIKNSKLGRAISYVCKIRIRIELPDALPEGRGEE